MSVGSIVFSDLEKRVKGYKWHLINNNNKNNSVPSPSVQILDQHTQMTHQFILDLDRFWLLKLSQLERWINLTDITVWWKRLWSPKKHHWCQNEFGPNAIDAMVAKKAKSMTVLFLFFFYVCVNLILWQTWARYHTSQRSISITLQSLMSSH